jgi:murein DD-endopeptidase MepM/ murein hydrolase activator NlpD
VSKGTNSGSGGGNSGNSQTWQNPLPGYPSYKWVWFAQQSFEWYPRVHWGIDIGTSGKTPSVKAAKSGKVVVAGWNNQGYGNLVIIEHADGTRSYYAHLSSIAVSPGASINEEQILEMWVVQVILLATIFTLKCVYLLIVGKQITAILETTLISRMCLSHRV